MNTMGKSEPTITFLGAAGTVTGSRFLLTSGDTRVLVDAGMFQGLKELRLKNWEPFAIDPKDLSAIVLTHAHLDHCGFIPKLVKDGFDGKIHSTENTAKLAEVILRDSARIQTEDAKWAAKKGFSKHNPPKALYEEKDAIKAMNQFETHEFNQRVQVAEQTFATFHPAGHILGSAFVELEFFGKRLLFTGDMGRPNHPLLVTPEGIPAGHFDAIITESTYGDRKHEAAGDDLETVINETVAKGGSILIPAFAVDRTAAPRRRGPVAWVRQQVALARNDHFVLVFGQRLGADLNGRLHERGDFALQADQLLLHPAAHLLNGHARVVGVEEI